MENNKLEKVIFILLRVFGILAIIGSFMGAEGVFYKQSLLMLNQKTIIGNVYMMSPIVLVEMVVAIILYLVFLKIVERHIRISGKCS